MSVHLHLQQALKKSLVKGEAFRLLGKTTILKISKQVLSGEAKPWANGRKDRRGSRINDDRFSKQVPKAKASRGVGGMPLPDNILDSQSPLPGFLRHSEKSERFPQKGGNRYGILSEVQCTRDFYPL